MNIYKIEVPIDGYQLGRVKCLALVGDDYSLSSEGLKIFHAGECIKSLKPHEFMSLTVEPVKH